jgi:hypothetical protein
VSVTSRRFRDDPTVADEIAYLTPEARARVEIDRMLAEARWSVQSAARVNLSEARGVAVREFALKSPHGRVDYLLFVDGKAVGVLEAKKEGQPLTGVEWTGPAGPQGPAGPAGLAGKTGANGSNGSNGSNGGFDPNKVSYVTGPAQDIAPFSQTQTAVVLTASCPAGTKAIAGGGFPSIALQGDSEANADGSSWRIIVVNNTTITVTGAYAFAVCAAP